MTDDLPTSRRPDDTPPVRTLADLERHWLFVKGPWGFSAPQIFCQLIDGGGRLMPQIVNITECPAHPDDEMLASLLHILTDVLTGLTSTGSVALMFARPGGDPLTDTDRAWARALTAAGVAAPIEVWPVFCANDVSVRIAAPDDLAA